MKKLFALILTIIVCLSFAACGNSENVDTTKESSSSEAASTENELESSELPINENELQSDETPVVENKLILGEMASTDIVDFTLEDAQFTYYVSNSSSNYVEPTDKPNSMFAASIGHCYVSATFTITNKDRGGSISFCGLGDEWTMNSWELTYNGEKYQLKGFDLNDKNASPDLSFSALVNRETGKTLSEVGTSNEIIRAGETYTFRTFFIVDFEPTSLTDSFDLTISVPNSKSEKETFTYVITEEDRKEMLYQQAVALIENGEYFYSRNKLSKIGDYKDAKAIYDETTKPWAVRYGVSNKAKEYFLANIDEFETITGTELSSVMIGTWQWENMSNPYQFLEDGTIDDGSMQKRSWSVSGDYLIYQFYNIYNDLKTLKLTVKKVYDEGYLLVGEDGKLYTTMYRPD